MGNHRKVIDGKSTIKAWLVARGFQEEHNFIVESPPTHNCTSRKAFITAEIKPWEVQTIDIKATYLLGQNINKELISNNQQKWINQIVSGN